MKPYTFIDYTTQGYIALVGLLVLFMHGDAVPAWRVVVLAHAVGLVGDHLLIHLHARHPANRFLDFLRHFYPVLLYTGFFWETASLNQMLYPGYLDPVFIRAEQAIFGCQPSLELMQRAPFLLISEVLYAAYFSYYVMIVGVGMALFLRQRRQFYHYISTVSLVFYVCYLIFIFLPVIGPDVFHKELAGTNWALPADVAPAVVPAFPEAIQGGPFFQIMAFIYRHFKKMPGGAFPSSHVAIALVTVYFSSLYLRRIRLAHMVVAILLSLATVYCRYHYVIDVAAGALTAAILIPLGNWLYFRGAGEKPPPRSQRNKTAGMIRVKLTSNGGTRGGPQPLRYPVWPSSSRAAPQQHLAAILRRSATIYVNVVGAFFCK